MGCCFRGCVVCHVLLLWSDCGNSTIEGGLILLCESARDRHIRLYRGVPTIDDSITDIRARVLDVDRSLDDVRSRMPEYEQAVNNISADIRVLLTRGAGVNANTVTHTTDTGTHMIHSATARRHPS